MIRAQFRIRLPDGVWVREVSEAFPDASFKLLAGYRLEGKAIELGEIVADEADACVDAMRAHPAIARFELLESAGRRALGKYEVSDTNLYEFVDTSSLPIEFPIVARNGWFTFDLTGTREELERLQTVLETADVAYELQSVITTTETESLLTDRQREVLEAAIREGYFEVPRECTLADLADTVDVDKSTASTILRRGQATVLKWFLSGPEAKGRRVR
ncbi:helix-turn-helix domain-containing protein [Natrinema halophilum]|uniref:Helix-turn-helix domain-containing protein n=1 Tax=Natrinema halophilum TaxID=1699371 RepID=A0A7D5L072_9EURY|nr:helix-turn-helix domain-containing protein [Natrinema halophilum]QLG51040.1 helix-turn-helix domain-containing protein [Natrinema halophilum]